MGMVKDIVYSVNAGTQDAMLGRILDAAYHIRRSRRKLQRATRVHNQTVMCVAAGGGIFENQL